MNYRDTPSSKGSEDFEYSAAFLKNVCACSHRCSDSPSPYRSTPHELAELTALNMSSVCMHIQNFVLRVQCWSAETVTRRYIIKRFTCSLFKDLVSSNV